MSQPVQPQQPNFYPMSTTTGTNFAASMPGHIAVLPVMFPWQQPSQMPYHTPFEAHHYTTGIEHRKPRNKNHGIKSSSTGI